MDLKVDDPSWRDITHEASPKPSAKVGASSASAHDGERLYQFGGFQYVDGRREPTDHFHVYLRLVLSDIPDPTLTADGDVIETVDVSSRDYSRTSYRPRDSGLFVYRMVM